MSARPHIIHFPLGRVDVAWLIASDFCEAIGSSLTTRNTWSLMCPAHFLPCFFFLQGSKFVPPHRETAKPLSLSGIPAAPIKPLLLIFSRAIAISFSAVLLVIVLPHASRMPPVIRTSNPAGVSRMFSRWQTAKRAFSNLEIFEWAVVQLIVQVLSYMRAHWLCAVKWGISTTETSTWVVKEAVETGIHACFFFSFRMLKRRILYSNCQRRREKGKNGWTNLVACICTNTPSGQFCAELFFSLSLL